MGVWARRREFERVRGWELGPEGLDGGRKGLGDSGLKGDFEVRGWL